MQTIIFISADLHKHSVQARSGQQQYIDWIKSDETQEVNARTTMDDADSTLYAASQGNTCLSLNVMLNETSGCRSDGDSSGRFVDLKIYRLFRPERDGTVRQPELLRGRKIDSWNPACEDDQTARERPMLIEAENVVFTCVYKGIAAAARSNKEKMARFAAHACSGS